MLRCEDCEYFGRDGRGHPKLRCDPCSTIKEPECLAKWQVLRLDELVRSYQAMLDMYRRLAPLQERMIKHMERELDEAEEADEWKRGYETEDDMEEDDEDDGASDSFR